MERLQEIAARKAELKALLESEEEVNLEEVRSELDSLDTEEKTLVAEEEERKAKLQAEEEERKAKAEAEAAERKKVAEELNKGQIEGHEIEGERKMENVLETRANEFVNSNKTEMRSVLSSGKIATPVKAGGINDLAAIASSIVDDVNAIALTGNGAWTVAYKATHADAANVTDGSAVGGTASTYDYVTINPAEVGVFDEISKQVAKMTPVDYLTAVEKSALIALRAKMASIIVANVKASALADTKTVAIDADYLKSVVLGFKAIETKGATCLYLSRGDLLALGKVRGANEKKALYDITFEDGTLNAGTISEGGLATKFRVLDTLADGEQLFGQPQAIDMPMWDNYEIATDEGGDFFKRNMIGVRGLQTANADLVAKGAMVVVKNA